MIRDYNLKLIKTYLRKSYVTIGTYVVMLVMFIVSVAMTYARNSSGDGS